MIVCEVLVGRGRYFKQDVDVEHACFSAFCGNFLKFPVLLTKTYKAVSSQLGLMARNQKPKNRKKEKLKNESVLKEKEGLCREVFVEKEGYRPKLKE